MTPTELVKQLRKYVRVYGHITLGPAELRLLRPFLSGRYIAHADRIIQYNWKWKPPLTQAWTLLDEIEKSIAADVAKRLTA